MLTGINKIMLSDDRRRELEFQLRVGHPILVSGRREDPHGIFHGVIDDVYTLIELVDEGVVVVRSYDYTNARVCLSSDQSLRLVSPVGNREECGEGNEVSPEQDLVVYLDTITNDEFATSFYSGLPKYAK